jgi:hypothetical protein
MFRYAAEGAGVAVLVRGVAFERVASPSLYQTRGGSVAGGRGGGGSGLAPQQLDSF